MSMDRLSCEDPGRVLFIFNRWYYGDPALGETVFVSKFLATYREFRGHEPDVVYYDEFVEAHPDLTSSNLIGHIGNLAPDVIFFAPVPAISTIDKNVRMEVLDVLRANLDAVFVFMALDTMLPQFQTLSVTYSRYADLVITCDGGNPALLAEISVPVSNLWTPIAAPTSMLKPIDKRGIPLSFSGTIARYEDRAAMIEKVLSLVPRAVMHDLTSQPPMAYDRLMRLMEQSASTLHLAKAYLGGDQLKGRIFEAASRGVLIFEERNAFTGQYFDEKDHVIVFDDTDHLLSLVKTFDSSDHRERAAAAQVHWQANWSGQQFWEAAFKAVSSLSTVPKTAENAQL